MGSNSSTTFHSPNYYKRDTKENKKIESILKKSEPVQQGSTDTRKHNYPNRKANSHQHLRTKVVHPQTATRSSPSLLYGITEDFSHNHYHEQDHDRYEEMSPKRSNSPRLSKRAHPQLSPIRSNSPQPYSPNHHNQFEEHDVLAHRGSLSSETSISSLTTTSSSVVSFSASLTGMMPVFQPHPPIISLLNRSNSLKRAPIQPSSPSSPNMYATPKKRTTLITDNPFTTPQALNQQAFSPPISSMYKRSTSVVDNSPKPRTKRSSSVNTSSSSFQTNVSLSSILNPNTERCVEIPLLAVTRPEAPPCTSNIRPISSSTEISNKRYLSVKM